MTHKITWSGDLIRKLKTSTLIASGSLLLLANAIVVALGLIRTPLVTWVMPKNEVGMIGVVAAWFPFVQLLSMTGLDTAAYHYSAKGQLDAFRVNLRVRLRWSLLSSAVLLLGGLYWLYAEQPLLTWMFIIAGLSYPVTAGLSANAGFLSSQEKFKSLFWYRIFESLTDFAGFIPLAFSIWLVSKVSTFYAANQLATAMMMIWVSIKLLRTIRNRNTIPLAKNEEDKLVGYGKHLTVINSFSVVQGRSDAVIVSIFLPLATVADFSIALVVQEQIRRLWNIYISLRYPGLARLDTSIRARNFFFEGLLVWIAFIFIGLGLFLLSFWLIPVILPASYTNSLGYLAILIAAGIIGMPGGLSEIYFRTYETTRPQYVMRSISATIGIFAPLALVVPFGAYGAAGGHLLANLALSITGLALAFLHAKGIERH